MEGVELQYFLVNGIAFQLSPQDALSPVVHIDVVDEVHDPLHFSRIIILITISMGSLELNCGWAINLKQ